MDYSPYFYNYNPKKLPPPREFNSQKNRGNLGHVVLVLLVLICLVCALVLGVKFSGVSIVANLEQSIFGNSTKYYIVTTRGTEYLEEAKVKCLSLRLSGNAGYVYSKDGSYFVALATYLDKKSAEEILSKNEDLVMHELEFNKRKMLDNATDDGITNLTIDTITDTIKVLYDLSIKLALKETTTIDVLHTLETNHAKLIELKEKVLKTSPKNKDTLIEIIDPPLGTLTAIIGATSHQSLLGELRYAVTISVVGICGNEE